MQARLSARMSPVAFLRTKFSPIAVTNQRLVFFRVGAMSFTSKPKAVASTIALGAIAGVQITKGKIIYKVEFDFRDGSATTIDLYRANSPRSATDALCSVLPHTLR